MRAASVNSMSEAPGDLLPESPLSLETKQAWQRAVARRQQKETLEVRRDDMRLQRETAQAKSHELLTESTAAGDFSASARSQARKASGLEESEQQLEALEHLIRVLPELAKKDEIEFRRRQARERQENFDRLWRKELWPLLKKEIFPHFRALSAFLPEVERIAAEARRWSHESPAPPDNGGHKFPLSPVGSVCNLVNYVLRTFPLEIEGK